MISNSDRIGSVKTVPLWLNGNSFINMPDYFKKTVAGVINHLVFLGMG